MRALFSDTRTGALAAIHLAVLLFGLAGLFGKWLLLPAWMIVFGRTVVAALSLWVLMGIFRIPFRPRYLRDVAGLAMAGGLLAGHWAAFFHSIQVASVAVGLVSFSSFPLFVTVMEPMVEKKALRPFDLFTALLVLGGLVVLVPAFDPGDRVFQGAFWGVVSGASFAALAIMNRRYVRRYPALAIAACENTAAALLLMPAALSWNGHLGSRDVLLLAALGIFCTAVSHSLFIHGMRKVKAQLAGVIAGLEPVYGVLLAFFLLNELPSFRTLAGGIMICGAVLLASLNEIRRDPFRETTS